jgi:hypothetical protein
MKRPITILLAVLLSGVALADEPAADVRSWVDRPVVLPKWTLQTELAGGYASGSSGGSGAPGPGFVTEVALTLGMPWDTQLGLYERQVFPQTESGISEAANLMLNVQHAFLRQLAARADLGFSSGESGFANPGISLGIGAPLRWRFDEHVALISGEALGRAFGSPSADGDKATFTPSEDLFTVRQINLVCFEAAPPRFPGGGFGGGGCGGNGWIGTVGLPIGLLVQPTPGLALSVRTGVRVSFGVNVATPVGPGSSPFYIPFAADVAVTPVRWLDVGVTGQVAGTPEAPLANPSFTLWTNLRV